MAEPIETQTVEKLKVKVYADRRALGEAAGRDVAECIRAMQRAKPNLRMIFAAAPSQYETLAALAKAQGIDWSKITAFHMDEYIGLPQGAPQKFSKFVREHIFDPVKPGKVHL